MNRLFRSYRVDCWGGIYTVTNRAWTYNKEIAWYIEYEQLQEAIESLKKATRKEDDESAPF